MLSKRKYGSMALRSGRRIYSSLYRYANPAGIGLARAVRQRLGGSFTNTMTQRRRVQSGAGITTQYDRRLIYRKRYMPRRKKRIWKKFIRKVNAVAEKDLGSRTVIRNNQVASAFTMTTSNDTNQALAYVTLYGLNGALDVNNDLRQMRNDTDLGTSGKMIFKSAVFDMTVTNTSTRLDESTNPSIRLEVDVYELTSGKEWGNAGTGAAAKGLIEVFAEGATDTANIPGTTNSLSLARRGCTPFDLPSAISEYKLKILKKTKYFINERDTFTYQIRDPMRHVVDRQTLNRDGENLPGMTRFLLFIYRPVPGYLFNEDIAGITIGVTRKYMYKINQSTQDYDVFNS